MLLSNLSHRTHAFNLSRLALVEVVALAVEAENGNHKPNLRARDNHINNMYRSKPRLLKTI